jgi:hypothetical protein
MVYNVMRIPLESFYRAKVQSTRRNGIFYTQLSMVAYVLSIA